MKKQIYLALSFLLCSACSTANVLPDLSNLDKVHAYQREEGSGTRDEFNSLLSLTPNNSYVANSSKDMIEKIQEDTDGIGYVAYSAYDNQENIHILSIDDISPTLETLKNGKYPLSRQYYLAYSGELNEVENDFLTYVLSKGQDIISTEAIPIRNSTSFLSNKASGTITINGSTSMSSIMEKLIEEYKTYNPNVTITLTITDSTTGLNQAMQQQCDIAMSSRNLKDYEKELLNTKAIATDAIAIIVNDENKLTNLSTKQLKSLYNSISKWQELS